MVLRQFDQIPGHQVRVDDRYLPPRLRGARIWVAQRDGRHPGSRLSRRQGPPGFARGWRIRCSGVARDRREGRRRYRLHRVEILGPDRLCR
uniref:Uncharacterized protein n=1 Tax=Rhizophora mucronata TaxID=61149 RepID=A0A2P2IZY9_RHIMU